MFPLKDDNPIGGFPVINLLIIVLNIFFFALSLQNFDYIIKNFGLVPSHFDFLKIFSSMFLHGGLLHIVGNMWFLWIFGDNVESVFGKIGYFFFYIICGVFAALFHTFFNPSSVIPVVGASGAVSGVMGAYLVLFPWARVRTLIMFFFFLRVISVPAYFYIFIWFFWQIAGLGVPSNVAYIAHIGGFLVGVFFGLLKRASVPKRRRKKSIRFPFVLYLFFLFLALPR